MNSDAPARYDDFVYLGVHDATPGIAIAEKLSAGGHSIPEYWLRARVRGWMELEGQGLAFYLGTYTADGRWIYCSSDKDRYIPKTYRVEYAMRVAKHLNQQIPNGGAWFAGWTGGGRVFYMLFKDAQGDIQIPIECDKPFIVIRNWTPEVWERHAAVAHSKWVEFHKNQEYGRGQQVKLAQGEKPSAQHEHAAPAVGI